MTSTQKQSDPRFYEFRDAVESDFATAALLIERDPTILDARNSVGETALHYLAIENQLANVEWLLDRGAEINTRDKFGDTPLSSSALLGYLPMCKMLIARGADLRTTNHDDNTPISQAAQGESVEVLKFLLSQLDEEEEIQTFFDDATASIALGNDTATAALLKKHGLIDPWQ